MGTDPAGIGRLPLKLPSFRLVKSDEIERGGDRVHFTTAGRLELGRRYAAAMIELLPAAK